MDTFAARSPCFFTSAGVRRGGRGPWGVLSLRGRASRGCVYSSSGHRDTGVSLYNSIRAPAKMSLCPVRGGNISQRCIYSRCAVIFQKNSEYAAAARLAPRASRLFSDTDEEYAPRENLRSPLPRPSRPSGILDSVTRRGYIGEREDYLARGEGDSEGVARWGIHGRIFTRERPQSCTSTSRRRRKTEFINISRFRPRPRPRCRSGTM